MGLMEPVSAVYTGNKGWTLIHRCKKCGFERKNMVSTETACPDDWDLVVKLSVQE
jgi:predicted Zn-ribbon and HTH transcriptional regulator